MKNLIFNIKAFFTVMFDKEYHRYVREMINTPSERWFMDGERKFTKKELYYQKVYELN